MKRVGKIINMKKNRNLVTFINDATPKENSYLKRRKLVAKRDIKAGEEITLSYPHYEPKKNQKRRTEKRVENNFNSYFKIIYKGALSKLDCELIISSFN